MSAPIRRQLLVTRPSHTLRHMRPTAISHFHCSARLAAGKESALHNEGRAEEAEAHKQEVLEKAKKQGKGEWRDGLASDSESAIKADRGEMDAGKGSISELQHHTAKKAEQEKK